LITDDVASGNDDTNNATDISFVNSLATKYHDNNIRMLLLTTDKVISNTDQSYVNMVNTTGGSVSTPITDVTLLVDAIKKIP
jgi:hypothetical protein